MSDFQFSPELRAFVESDAFPKEAWTIVGTCSNGGPYWSRMRIGGDESRPLKDDQLRRLREQEVSRMNSMGASVRLIREKVGDDLMWHEVTE